METIMPIIMQFIQTYILPPLGLVITGLLGLWLSRWQAREQVKTMQANSKLAVQAVEQIAANQPPEVKAKMALQIAQQLNAQAKINVPDAIVSPVNEAHVLTLPSNPEPPKG